MILTELEKKEYDRYFSYNDFSRELTNKTFLITGAKGLVGQGLIKWLLYLNEKYNSNINIMASTRNEKNIPNYIEEKDNIKYCKFGTENELYINEKIDYIIHCATPTDRESYTKTPYETLQVILDGTKNVIDLALNQYRINNNIIMLYISSEEVYGAINSNENIDEKYVGSIDSLNTRSCYPLGKKTSELMCKIANIEYGLDTRILRPTVIFGLFQKYEWDRIENEVLKCIIENKNLHMKTKGLTKKSIIYSLDVISAIFNVLFNGEKGEVYNVTNTDTYDTVSNNAEKMFKVLNNNCKIEYDNENIENGNSYLEKREVLMNIEKIRKIGFIPHTNLEDIYRIDIERFADRL